MSFWLAAGLGLAMSLSGQEIRLTQVASGIAGPTDIQTANDGSGRLFFVQQVGLVRIFRNGTVNAQPFLDITNKTLAGGERGLLGLAFPVGFAQNQRFYADYTDLNGDTIIAQYHVSSNPDVASSASETILLKILQPFANHNGGQIRFGPDGFLYVGMGDGGSGGDPLGNGQNRGTLLGKLLRIDVESQPGQVRIPPDNPFLNVPGARPEIWAEGLRNPWRFSFDRTTHDLWIADVGEATYEEVDFQPAASHGGENYGWNLMEGAHCVLPGCNQQGLTLPITEYQHTDGCAVMGGVVYRGESSPALRGTYLYGDFCNGRIWGVERQGTGWVNRLLLASGFNITTFGEDEAGEIFVANAATGTIYHIEGDTIATITSPPPGSTLTSSSVVFQWTPGTAAARYQLSVSRVPGEAEIYNQDQASAISANVTGLPASGTTLYVRLWSLIGGIWKYNDYTYVACTGSCGDATTAGAVTNPAPGSTLSSTSPTFQWTAGIGAAAYQLSVSRVFGQAEVYNQYLGNVLSATVSGLPANGGTMYVRLWTLVSGAWKYNDYVYIACTNCVGNSGAGAITSPAPGSTLSSSAVTFRWTAGVGAAAYQLSISRLPGQAEIYNQYLGNVFSANVSGLLTGGGTLYVRLWTLISGAWQYNDYTYRACNPCASNSGAGTITSPAPGSPLTSSTALFRWTAGTGAAAYQLSISRVPGQAELYNQYLGNVLSASVTGLPANGNVFYVRLWTLIGGAWQFNDSTFTACSGSCGGASQAGAITSPTPGTVLPSAGVLFQWTAGTGAAAYQLSISRVPGQAELYNQYLGNVLSANVTSLPANGGALYVRLWTLISGQWQFNDYTYTML